MDKHGLSKRDICSLFITRALHAAGWDGASQIREEVGFTKGRIIVRGKLVTRACLLEALLHEALKPATNAVAEAAQ